MQSSTDTPNALTDLGKALVNLDKAHANLSKAQADYRKCEVVVVVETAKEHAKGNEGPTFIDARSAVALGISRKTFLRLARQEAFPTHKAGKTVLAKRVDVVAYIEAQNGARPRPARVPSVASQVDVNSISAAEFYGVPGKGK